MLGVLPTWSGLERPSFEVGAALFSGILYAPGLSPSALAGLSPLARVPPSPLAPRPRTLTLPWGLQGLSCLSCGLLGSSSLPLFKPGP